MASGAVTARPSCSPHDRNSGSVTATFPDAASGGMTWWWNCTIVPALDDARVAVDDEYHAQRRALMRSRPLDRPRLLVSRFARSSNT